MVRKVKNTKRGNKVYELLSGKKSGLSSAVLNAIKNNDSSFLKKQWKKEASENVFIRRELTGKEKVKKGKGFVEKEVIILPLKNGEERILTPSEFEALRYIARGKRESKANVLKGTSITAAKYKSLEKLVKQLSPSLLKKLAQEAEIEMKMKQKPEETEISFHNTRRRWI